MATIKRSQRFDHAFVKPARSAHVAAFSDADVAAVVAHAPAEQLPAYDQIQKVREHIDSNVKRVWENNAVAAPLIVDPSQAAEIIMDKALLAGPDWIRDSVNIISKLHAEHAVLHYISVKPDDRRQGLGTKAYKEWEAELPDHIKFIEVESLPNANALAFWHSLGFVKTSSLVGQQDAFAEFTLVKYRSK